MDAVGVSGWVIFTVGVLVGALAGAAAVAAIAMRALPRRGSPQGEPSASLSDALAPVRESVESLRRAADTANRDRAAAEAAITTQLAAVQERYQSLEESTGQLAAALAGGQTRGQWGEMQLEGLLEHAGLLEGTHFSRQESRDGDGPSLRPDVIVRLAGGGEVMVDAKFPFEIGRAHV